MDICYKILRLVREGPSYRLRGPLVLTGGSKEGGAGLENDQPSPQERTRRA